MKQEQIEQMSKNELEDKLQSSIEELFNLKFSASIKGMENPSKYRVLKKDIARFKTEKTRRKKAGEKDAQ